MNERTRRVAFVLGALLIAAIAAFSFLDLGGGDDGGSDDAPPAAEAPPGQTSPAVPSEEPSTTGPVTATTQPVGQLREADALRAARRFLNVYLPWTQGRTSARRLAAVSGARLYGLLTDTPRNQPPDPRRRPRVIGLHVDSTGETWALVLGEVDDTIDRYPISLTVSPEDGDLRVTDMG